MYSFSRHPICECGKYINIYHAFSCDLIQENMTRKEVQKISKKMDKSIKVWEKFLTYKADETH